MLTRFAKLRKTSCDSTWYTVSRNVTRYCRKNCVSYRRTVIWSTSSLISSAYYRERKEDKGRSLSVCSINGNFLIISAPSVGVRSDGSRFTYVHTQAPISFFCHFGSQTTTPVHYWMPIVIVPDLSIDSRASAILAHSTRYHILPRNRAVTATVLIVTRVIGSLRLYIGIHSSVRFRIRSYRKYCRIPSNLR